MKIPNFTYRLQFHSDFGFRQARQVIGYLARLGGPWIYASPIFAARRGSSHGYDIIDFDRINPELGSEAEFVSLIERLHASEMGWLQDMVPNHMAFSGENRLLADLFEKARHSAVATFFDICWQHPAESLDGRLAAPLLGDRLSNCIERGEIGLALNDGALGAVYGDQFFPLRLGEYKILDPECRDRGGSLPESAAAEWRDAVHFLAGAGAVFSVEIDSCIEKAKQTIREWVEKEPSVRRFTEQRLAFSHLQSGPKKRTVLRQILADQVYRLRHWRTAAHEINYRRFFDINELIALRQELPEVFIRTHGRLLRMIEEGTVDGIRIDHIDGLLNPFQYLDRLRSACGDVYIVTEKILALDEALSECWPVQGTTGYEFADRITRLLCLQDPQDRLKQFYLQFSGRDETFADVCQAAKRQLLQKTFAGDLDNWIRRVRRISAAGAGVDRKTLKDAATEMLVRFPVYRTYSSIIGTAKQDADCIRGAAAAAAKAEPDLLPGLDVIQNLLLAGGGRCDFSGGEGAAETEAAARFQQLCAPLAAKGIEDTALYRYFPLACLNDVGGAPSCIGLSLDSFHRFAAERGRRWPHTLNALSTHDSKRSEDVRARLSVLSELPEVWARRCTAWNEMNRRSKERFNQEFVPDPNVEYLLYQTLLGTWPFDLKSLTDYSRRISRYMVKAVREAKERTSWETPSAGYEEALCRFIERLLHPRTRTDPFREDFGAFARKVSRFGVFNTLSQTLIKMTAPGIPDIYQGTEIFDFSLVDPDNRRPVDFGRRDRLLKEICSLPPWSRPQQSRKSSEKGCYDRMKLWLVYRSLQTRKSYTSLFQNGGYRPVYAEGRFADRVVAFARIQDGRFSLTAVPRLLTAVVPDGRAPLGAVWSDTALVLPDDFPAVWQDTLTGETHEAAPLLPLARLMQWFPAALLIGGRK